MNRILTTRILPVVLGLASMPALAGDDWYIALGATSARIAESDQRIANAPAPGATLVTRNKLDNDAGWSLAAGRSFGNVRAELEFSRFGNDSGVYAITAPFTASVRQEGKLDVESVALNGYWDFRAPEARLRPFLGVGLGHAKVSALRIAGLAANPAVPPFRHLDDNDSGFAWQASAGLSWHFSEHVALSARYRRFDAGAYQMRDSRGEQVRGWRPRTWCNSPALSS